MSAGVATPVFTGKISPKWRKIFRKLPYDVFRDADGFWFDEETADYVIDFIETHIHYTEGEMMGELMVLEDWQKAIFGAIFGWKQIGSDLRRFKFVWFYIPRKNTKTMMLAVMAIIMFLLEAEGGAQNILAGADEEQAAYILKIVKGMIAQDDEIADRVQVFAHSMQCESNVLKIISANYKAKHGKNVNFAAIDEVHEHPNADLVNALITSSIARRQPLFVEATTADEEGESYCNDRHEYAKSVRDGVYRVPNFLPIIYELTDAKRWDKEKAWAEVNPNLGVSIKIENMRELCQKAKQMPSFKAEFCRLHLNMKTQSQKAWLDLADWDLCTGLQEGENAAQWRERMLEELRGCVCWGGLDLGSVSDLTAFTLCFDRGDDNLIFIPWVWCPSDAIDRKEEKYRDSYRVWVDEGFMLTTPGGATDYSMIRDKIVRLSEQFNIIDIGVDTQFQGHETAIYLQEHHGLKVFSFPQGLNAMSSPTQDFERRVRSQMLTHGANPLLRWCVSHCEVICRGDLMRPVKEHKGSPKKIDPLVAGVFALGRWHVREKDNMPSQYNSGGRLTFF